jgi:hypothetical protein
MPDVTAVPVGAFLDTRGAGRALRVTWHQEAAPHGPIVLLSLWREQLCVASFRLPVDDVPDLIDALRSGLDEAYGEVTRPARP